MLSLCLFLNGERTPDRCRWNSGLIPVGYVSLYPTHLPPSQLHSMSRSLGKVPSSCTTIIPARFRATALFVFHHQYKHRLPEDARRGVRRRVESSYFKRGCSTLARLHRGYMSSRTRVPCSMIGRGRRSPFKQRLLSFLATTARSANSRYRKRGRNLLFTLIELGPALKLDRRGSEVLVHPVFS